MKNKFFTRKFVLCASRMKFAKKLAGYQKGMVISMDIKLGDIVKLKKQHPCGSSEWEVLRVGMDFRLRCLGCGHQIMIPRKQVEKNIRQIKAKGTERNG